MKYFKTFFLAVCTLTLTGCGESQVFESPTIEITNNKISLVEGTTYQLEVVTSDTKMMVFYSSQNNAIATISESGLITAIAVGETVCYAQVGLNKAACAVSVTPYEPDPDLRIDLAKTSFTLEKDDEFVLPITIRYGEEVVEEYTLTAEIADETIVSFSEGVFTGLAIGETDVLLTATYLDLTDELLIHLHII